MSRYRKKRRTLALLGAAAALLWAAVFHGSSLAAEQTYAPDEVEAAFLYRFAGFVSWPREALQAPVFTIAVLDDDAVASELALLLPGREIQGRPAQVRRIQNIAQLGDAQILYVGGSDTRILKHWLAAVAGRPVLVVTSQSGGLDDGSMINFLIVNSHVRFEVSLGAARRSGLTISADLLSVATHVEGGPIGSERPCQIQPQAFPAPVSCPPRLAAR